jgi:hypothetical protein
MILTSIDFYESKGKDTYWDIRNVHFGMFNLVIGLNATGKTRLLNVISNLVKMLSRKTPVLLNGSWKLKYKDRKTDDVYHYNLDISDRIVNLEEIKINQKSVLEREKENGKIFSYISNTMIDFHPPERELTLYVRRDVKEFPFLEEILTWTSNFHGYMFSTTNPHQITIPNSVDALLENLSTTPYLLLEAMKDPEIIQTIIEDFSLIGYPIDTASVERTRFPGVPGDVFVSVVKEKDLACKTSQMQMSQGMYRAFSLVVIIQYLLKLRQECTVVIDDLGEGLDFERSSKITTLLFEKIKNSDIQLIVTSNDRFLINAVDMQYINLLERNGHVVDAYNYVNSKEKFDDFRLTGLNTFDFFRGKMYQEWGEN